MVNENDIREKTAIQVINCTKMQWVGSSDLLIQKLMLSQMMVQLIYLPQNQRLEEATELLETE
jgi:hypothetical protein